MVVSPTEYPRRARPCRRLSRWRPAVADFAQSARIVGVAAHQRRHVERDAETAAAGGEQHLVSLIGLLRVAEPTEHRIVGSTGIRSDTAPGEGYSPGQPVPLETRRGLQWGVQRVDFQPTERGEIDVAGA